MQHALSQSALIPLQLQLIKVVLWGITNPGDCKSREHQGVTPWQVVFCVSATVLSVGEGVRRGRRWKHSLHVKGLDC